MRARSLACACVAAALGASCGGGDSGERPDSSIPPACNPNPCTDEHKGICTASGDTASCACDVGYTDDGSGTCIATDAPSYEDVLAWVTYYHEAHTGTNGDINEKSDAELADDPDAQRLLALCGADQRPVIPLLAWEYGGNDHAWIDPDVSALVYCTYTPVDPSTEHWSFADNNVVADVWVLFPDDNPCKDESGADQVVGCIGDTSNFEIIVDTASYHDGHGAGLELSEASTELKLIPPGGGPSIHLWTDL